MKQKPPTKEELMAMNRKERRRIGKIFKVHIPGSNIPAYKTYNDEWVMPDGVKVPWRLRQDMGLGDLTPKKFIRKYYKGEIKL